MLANWVQESTATTGTGTITLDGADAGFLAFTDFFQNNQIVQYTIEDRNNREIGFGLFTTSGTTLTRGPTQTLVSGVLDDTAPAAINLSGNATVFIAPGALSTMLTPDGAPPAGYVNSGHLVSSVNVDIALTADTLYASPFLLERVLYAGEMAIKVRTAQASSNMRIGFATADRAGEPDQLIFGSGNLDTSTTGDKVYNPTSKLLMPGWYWMLFVTDTTNVWISGANYTNGRPNPLGASNSGGGLFNREYKTGTFTYAALPTDVGAVLDTMVAIQHPLALLIGEA